MYSTNYVINKWLACLFVEGLERLVVFRFVLMYIEELNINFVEHNLWSKF